jgi:hypothetical protein
LYLSVGYGAGWYPKMITMKTAILTSYYRHLLGKEIDFEGQILAHKKELGK